jgi:hypothetical protein
LDDWKDVGICDRAKGKEADQDGDGGYDAGVVYGSLDLRVVSRRQMADDPAVYAFGSLRARELESGRLG